MEEFETSSSQGVVTEVFVTEVSKDNEDAYRTWIAKIHEAEAQFPGFKGMYLQAPVPGKGRHWVALLQFDTHDNLDRWLQSPERQTLLKEAEPFVVSVESHRVTTPFAGWFATLANEGGVPPVWKQTMLILLVLFPIVMLEMLFLSPRTSSLNFSLATFIGNALSVTLVSWPFLPFAIKSLRWWLKPKLPLRTTLLGILCVCVLYLFEVAFFWKLF